jgi:hypothetical protein
MVQPEFQFGSQQPHTISEFLWSHPEAPIKTSYAAAGLFKIAQLGGNSERRRVRHSNVGSNVGFLICGRRVGHINMGSITRA